MTDSQTSIIDENENELDLHSIEKLLPYSLDDLYVGYFLANPSNKSHAYRLACKEYGKDYKDVNVTQLAYYMHKRLSDRIYQELTAQRTDNIAIGQSRLRYLAENAQSESVQASTATTLYKSGDNQESTAGIVVNVNRDNVTISHKNQTLTIEDE